MTGDAGIHAPIRRSRAVAGFDASRLRTLRCNHAMLTQAELAQRTGISRGEISHLERGRRQPLVTTLRALCEALECRPEDLITEGAMYGTDSDYQQEATEDRARAAV